jgi:hypothetical protein
VKKPAKKTKPRPLTLRQLQDRARKQTLRRQKQIMQSIDVVCSRIDRIEKIQEILLAILRPIVTDIRRRPLQIDDFNRAAFQSLVDEQAKAHPEMFS